MGENEIGAGVIDVHLSKASRQKATALLKECQERDIQLGKRHVVPHPDLPKTWVVVNRKKAIKMGYLKTDLL